MWEGESGKGGMGEGKDENSKKATRKERLKLRVDTQTGSGWLFK